MNFDNMNNTNGFERALEIIRRDSKNRPLSSCCFGPTGTVGPTGPTGPAGPTTIVVGLTTTGAPGTDASVINTGTDDNLVLDFTIPEGPTGPAGVDGLDGATGPTGPTGPAGVDGLDGATGPTYT